MISITNNFCHIFKRMTSNFPTKKPTLTGLTSGTALSANDEHQFARCRLPLADQRGFTKTGGSRGEGQFTEHALVQPLDQMGAENNFRPRWGDIQFYG
jgi:hypothetical protein